MRFVKEKKNKKTFRSSVISLKAKSKGEREREKKNGERGTAARVQPSSNAPKPTILRHPLYANHKTKNTHVQTRTELTTEMMMVGC